MRKLLATTVVMAALATAGLGRADEPVEFTGAIQIGNPAQTAGVGITQTVAACNPDAAENGLDGDWIAAAGYDGYDAVLTLGEATSDGDVYFYDTECAQIDYSGMAQKFAALGAGPYTENTETGVVPAGTAFILVNGFFGLNITYTLTLTPPAEPAE